MSSIPLNRALEHKCNGADDGTNYDHWVKPDDSALKKVFETEAFSPSVIICIRDDESRQHEEEIHCKIAMIDACNQVWCPRLPSGPQILLS